MNVPRNLYKNVVIYQWLAFHGVGLALLFVAWLYGLVGTVIAADPTFITLGIMCLFGVAVLVTAYSAFQLNRERNSYQDVASELRRELISNKKDPISAYQVSLENRYSFYEWVQTILLTLGLIGTVVGIIMAFQSVDPSAIGDSGLAAGVISRMLEGMSVAFYTTLVGGIGYVWIKTTSFMLEYWSADHFSKVLGEL